MKRIIPEGKKIRIITLGCGKDIPSLLMREGASSWLDEITILYSYESIKRFVGEAVVDAWSEAGNSIVSKEFTKIILEGASKNTSGDVITVVINGSLSYGDQREDRINQIYLYASNGYFRNIILNPKDSRQTQENEIKYHLLAFQVSLFSRVIFSGSWNPFHEAHNFILNQLGYLALDRENPVVLDVTNNHPTKGKLSDTEMWTKIQKLEKVESNTKFVVCRSDAPKFVDKYNHYRDGKNIIIFAVGHDVWDNYKKSFEEEFVGIDDVSFLVFKRNSNNVEIPDSFLLHPDSFLVDVPEHLLDVSSTKIRENEKPKNV